MTDVAVRPYRRSFVARVIARFLAWMDEPVVLGVAAHLHINPGDWSDLPVHHPLRSNINPEL